MKKLTIRTLVVLGFAAFGTTALAVSFDCAKASNLTESAICQEPELRRLDDQLARVYQKVKYMPGVRAEQRDWIRFRNRECGGNFYCLKDEFKKRIRKLRQRHGSGGAGGSTGSTHGKVFSPDRGVVCDRVGKFCADYQGIALGLIKEYFGESAMRTWEKRMSKNFDKSRFTMSNGVHCDTNVQKCYTNKFKDAVSRKWTKRLFLDRY